MTSWADWQLDHQTWGWIIFILYFIVWETYTGIDKQAGGMLTDHLRPIFQNMDLAWFLALGLWIWMGFHFLIDGVDFAKVFNVGVGG